MEYSIDDEAGNFASDLNYTTEVGDACEFNGTDT